MNKKIKKINLINLVEKNVSKSLVDDNIVSILAEQEKPVITKSELLKLIRAK